MSGSGASEGRERPIAAGLAVALTLAAAALGPARLAAAEPDLPRHQLVFARHADAARSDYDIWRMCGDGTQLAALVVAPETQFQITVSPDGEELAWAGYVGKQRDIWRRPFVGGEAVKVTDHPADDQEPVFSPDGRRLAFISTRDHEKPELYTLELESGALRRWTDNGFHDSGASWSPDGTRIVFTRFFPGEGERSGTGELFELDLGSGAERQLTSLGGFNGGPDHSPDGATIAFHRVADGRAELWLMGADGSEARPITDTYIDEYSPAFSPDGAWLAYTAGTEHDGRGTFDLWLMRADGSGARVLNKAANTDAWPVWRPGAHYCR